MKILHYEYEQNNDQRDNEKWETVGVRMEGKNKQLSFSTREETFETNKKFEILSDSEDDESHAPLVERMSEIAKRKIDDKSLKIPIKGIQLTVNKKTENTTKTRYQLQS